MHRAFKVGLLALAALLPVLAGACSLDNAGHETAAGVGVSGQVLDGFTGEVLPVMLRDCGFHACHGSQERFFRVWGKGRARWDNTKTSCEKGAAPPCNFDDTTAFERDYSLQFTRSMVDLDNPADSLLLRKPLAVERGGADHEGVDKYGRNVYRTPDDDGYRTISRWVYAYAESQKRLNMLRGMPAAATPPVTMPPVTMPPVTTPPPAPPTTATP